MFNYLDCDIFTLDVSAIVIPTNIVGIAGAGMALQARKLNPAWYEQYRVMCLRNEHHIGEPVLHNTGKWGPNQSSTKFISFPTKRTPNEKSNFNYIYTGVCSLVSFLERHEEIRSIAITPLGCGCGRVGYGSGLVTRPMVERLLLTQFYHLSKTRDIYLIDFKNGGLAERDIEPFLK